MAETKEQKQARIVNALRTVHSAAEMAPLDGQSRDVCRAATRELDAFLQETFNPKPKAPPKRGKMAHPGGK